MSAMHDREAILAVLAHQRIAQRGQPLRASAHQDDPGAQRRQGFGRGSPQPGGRAGDQDGPARQGIRRGRIPSKQPPAEN